MDEVLKGILGLYNGAGGASLRALTPGGMWLSQAPQSATDPYIVLTPVAAPIEYVLGVQANTESCDVQMTVCTLSGTATSIVNAMAAMKSLYDFCTFTMTGHTLLAARRLSSQGPLRDDDTRGYTGYLEYRFLIGG